MTEDQNILESNIYGESEQTFMLHERRWYTKNYCCPIAGIVTGFVLITILILCGFLLSTIRNY